MPRKTNIELPDARVDKLVLEVRRERDRLRVQIDENLRSDDPVDARPAEAIPLHRVFSLVQA